jgi:hypothetical protein
MTKQRVDNHSTEFGLWLRVQPEIDSKKEGYVTSNVDYVWSDYRSGKWMLIEEKRYNSWPKPWQRKTFKLLHDVSQHDPNYKGFHLIIFEQTSPEDGKMWIDGRTVTKEDLFEFFRFESKEFMYEINHLDVVSLPKSKDAWYIP